MPSTLKINRAFREYYALLDSYDEKDADGESTTETAMKHLLGDWCSMLSGWSLIKESLKTPRGNTITPDGIIVDPLHIRRGYWEAKDTDDDLETEIESKRRDGYPFDKNLLFDDTVTAVLFQNDARLGDCRVRERECFERMLGDFFAWTSPPIQGFHEAMDRFLEDLPRFAKGLRASIERAKGDNRKFVEQLDRFFQMCRASLNPSVTPAQIDEMLAQHLLTERVARRVFRYDRFRQTNAVARELENLVDAFLGDAPSRDRHMAGLDQYFKAVETYADLVNDSSEKQDFLTKVYEPFLNVYSPKDADRLGIVYTPQPIVRFIVNSVEAALGEHFGKSLADSGVHILDPCTGTGNFIVEVLKKIKALRPSALERKYLHELWANEILLLPYYIAGLNIEATYKDLTGTDKPFPGVCFTDTLLLNIPEVSEIKNQFILNIDHFRANIERVHNEEKAPITVIFGNPPYSGVQEEENQGARNIPHEAVEKRIRDTYVKASKATLHNSDYDTYRQFIRWATDRIGETGILCFVTNNGFIDDFAADGIRKHLVNDYAQINHFNFKGNARTSGERRRREGGNIFEDKIRVGVGITLFIKKPHSRLGKVYYHEVGDYWKSAEKRDYIGGFKDIHSVEWRELKLTKEGREWFAPDTNFDEQTPLGNKEEKSKRPEEAESIFHIFSCGVKTNRDPVVYNFDDWQLEQRVKAMIDAYNLEIDRWKRSNRPKKAALDNWVNTDKINWGGKLQYIIDWDGTLKNELTNEHYSEYQHNHLRTSLYRPFTLYNLYFDRTWNNSVYLWHQIIPTQATEVENRVITLTDKASEKPFMSVVSHWITDLHFVGAGCQAQCFPIYVYDEDGTNRRLNVTPWGVRLFRTRYGLKGDYYDQKADADDPAFGPASPWKIFHYTYALLHAAGYREKYERNLKKSLPRIPLLGKNRTFVRLAELGEELAKAHLTYETAEPYELKRIEKSTKGVEFDWACPKLRLDSKDRTVVRYNDALTLAGVPPKALEYRLGNRGAVEWVCDQFRAYPAQDDFVIRLLERVLTVSLKTVDLVEEVDKLWVEWS